MSKLIADITSRTTKKALVKRKSTTLSNSAFMAGSCHYFPLSGSTYSGSAVGIERQLTPGVGPVEGEPGPLDSSESSVFLYLQLKMHSGYDLVVFQTNKWLDQPFLPSLENLSVVCCLGWSIFSFTLIKKKMLSYFFLLL